jgi:Uncharacterized protein conserved in bacteria
MSDKLNNFLNAEGKLTSFPSKRKMKIQALLYLSTKFELHKIYSEKEVNGILTQWHTFGDPATLRRELYNNMFMGRTLSGSEYWLEEKQPSIEELEKKYG